MLRRSLFVGLLAAPLVMQAAPTKQEQAAAFFSAAEIFFQAEEYEKALESYIESYKLSNFPELLFNIGQCYRALNQHQSALTSYQNYLAAVPNSSIRKDVEKWIVELKPLAAQEAANKPKEPEVLPDPIKEPEVVAPVIIASAPPSANTKKFLLPAGLVVGGVGMAAGAILIDREIQETGERTAAASAGRLALSIGADAALLGAAVSFLFAMRQPEPAFSLAPVKGGAIVTFQIGGAR